ncbi:MAG: hypothetical protein AABO58_18690 [Acidobacteriota bacterium]
MNEEDEKKTKHLEMLQAVISRLASNSFTIKGWGTTLVAALLAYIAKDGKPQNAWIVLMPTVVFWGLDAYYLGLERAFRDLYKQVSGQSHTDFSMVPPAGKAYFSEALFRPAVWPLYLMLIIITLVVCLCVQ